jgi:hypothetical protein
MVAQVLLIIAPDVWRHGGREGVYYVRVFRRSRYALPVVLLADTGNDADVSVVNRVDEICSVVADVLMDFPGVVTGQLDSLASWVTVIPAGLFGPLFGEMFGRVTFKTGRPSNTSLRHDEVEQLVGDRVRQLRAADCTRAALTKRGVTTANVSRH